MSKDQSKEDLKKLRDFNENDKFIAEGIEKGIVRYLLFLSVLISSALIVYLILNFLYQTFFSK
jgi:hypothetical protein